MPFATVSVPFFLENKKLLLTILGKVSPLIALLRGLIKNLGRLGFLENVTIVRLVKVVLRNVIILH